MTRNPTNFFTRERQEVLEDLLGNIEEHRTFLDMIGKASAELWHRYARINDPNNGRDLSQKLSASNGHLAFRVAIEPFMDPHQYGFRGSFLPKEAFPFINHDERIGGLPAQIYIMGLEMIAQGNPSVALSLAIDGSVLSALWQLGNERQKQRYVIDALSDKKMLAFAVKNPAELRIPG